jgi:YesN/AraC family two-component response regulator
VTVARWKATGEERIEAGATDYISKPVNVSHLLSLLGRLVRTLIPYNA